MNGLIRAIHDSAKFSPFCSGGAVVNGLEKTGCWAAPLGRCKVRIVQAQKYTLFALWITPG